MSIIGTVTFCTDCGNLLERAPGSAKQVCELCNAVTDAPPTSSTTTTSNPSAFPSALRQRRSAVQTLAAEDLNTEATISQPCPACGRPEMWFRTMQLRGADEGATVFYRCECGHRFNTNN